MAETVNIETGEIIETTEEATKKGKKKKEVGPTLPFRKYHVRITFKEEILGTGNADPDIHEKFIASKAPDAPSRDEEVAALGAEEVTRMGMTVFHRNADGNPVLWNYQVRGFLKSACKAIGEEIPELKVTAYKGVIDEHIIVPERQIVLHLPEGNGKVGNCQRPLRAETAQGPRVALANSETCPAGTWCEFTIINKRPEKVTDEHVELWLYKGRDNGLGQWRNSGKGAFKSKIMSVESIDPREYYREMAEEDDD